MAEGDTIIWRKDKPLLKQPMFWSVMTLAVAGLFTEGMVLGCHILGSHISDAWNCAQNEEQIKQMIVDNKTTLNQIKTIVWSDHENIIKLGTKAGFDFDPPKEEIIIKSILSTNL